MCMAWMRWRLRSALAAALCLVTIWPAPSRNTRRVRSYVCPPCGSNSASWHRDAMTGGKCMHACSNLVAVARLGQLAQQRAAAQIVHRDRHLRHVHRIAQQPASRTLSLLRWPGTRGGGSGRHARCRTPPASSAPAARRWPCLRGGERERHESTARAVQRDIRRRIQRAGVNYINSRCV